MRLRVANNAQLCGRQKCRLFFWPELLTFRQKLLVMNLQFSTQQGHFPTGVLHRHGAGYGYLLFSGYPFAVLPA